MPVHDTAETAGRAESPQNPAARSADTSRPARLKMAVDAMLGRVPRRWRLPLATYLVCQLIFLFWWMAFYPGLMSYDSVIYVVHVTTGPWVSDHSVVYDSLVWLTLHVTGDFGALTLAQTVAMSAAFAYTVAAFRRLGVPGRWTAVAAVILAALPPTGTFVIFVWKDVPFVICSFLIVPTLAHLVSLRGLPQWRRDSRVRWLIVAIGLEMLGMMLFRLNGFLIVVVAAIAMVCLLSGIRLRLAAAAAAAACLAFVLNLYVYPAVGIERQASSLAYGIQYADIAVAYADKPSSFTTADKRLMAQVAPLAAWQASATCYDSDPTNRIPGFKARSAKMSGQLMSLWFRILGRTPNLILDARICRGSVAWSIFSGPAQQLGGLAVYTDTISPDLYGLTARHAVAANPYRDVMVTRPLSSTLNVVARFLREVSLTPQLQWLLWRAAFWCYVSYVIVFVFARARRNWALLSLAAIVIGQQLGVLADNPAQLFRYMVSPIFVGIMLVPLLFAAKRTPPPGRVSPAAQEGAAAYPARDAPAPREAGQAAASLD